MFAITLGTLAGAVFMALHSVQGAQLGVPQMLQSRGQFGNWGALPIVVVVIVMYVGFAASSLVVAGPAVHALIPALSPEVGIALAGIMALVLALYGYDVIHGIQRVCAPVFAAALILLTLWVIFVHGLPAGFLSKGKLAFGPLLGMISIAAIFQISYAPYVSDYSRYLPRTESSRAAFWATYLGTSIGSLFPMIIGAMLGIIISGDTVLGIDVVTGPAGWLMMIIVFVGTANATAYNLYGFSLCSITAAETFKTGWIPRGWMRVILVTTVTLGALLIARAAASAFLTNFTNLLTVIFYLLVPWTTVNLLDYYVIEKGSYDVPEFFKPDGGIYGRVQWSALAAYVLGIAVQVPFMETTWYTGPVAAAIHGDISWIVGLTVSALLYLGLRKRSIAWRIRPALRPE